MIDTIGFKILLNDYQRDLIKKRSIETQRVDNNTQVLKFKIFNTYLKLGSYDRNINIFLSESDDKYCKLEFSVPKYAFGQNVTLFYPHQLKETLNDLYLELYNYFGDFPVIEKWYLMRLDICYAWKFLNQDIAEQILEVIRSYKIARKKVSQHDTGIFQKGSTYSLKWYLKYPEFYYHDFKDLLLQGRTEFAYNIANMANGVLRFEIEMRHQHLMTIFGNGKIDYRDITDEFCLEYLQKYFLKFFGGTRPDFMTNQVALNKLIKAYPLKKYDNKRKKVVDSHLALTLFEFYTTFHTLTVLEQKKYLSAKNAKTVYRLKKQLSLAGVSISKSDKIPVTNFDIPSPFCVNSTDFGVAEMVDLNE